jgi:peptidoglycan hydrolase CwlO-like protein
MNTRHDTPRSTAAAARPGGATTLLALAALLFATVVLLVALIAPPALAAPSLPALQREAKNVRVEMEALQSELQEVQRQLTAAEDRFEDVTRRLIESRRQLLRAQAELDLQREVVASRMVTMYKTGELTWVDLFASASSLTEAETAVTLLRLVSEEDQRQEEELRRLTREARRLEGDVESQREESLVAREDIRAEQMEMDQKLAERRVILQDLTARIKKILASGGLGPALAMASNGKFTQLTWAKALLVAMRLPVTTDNVAAVVAWEMAEGGHWYNSAYYNPLNTTQTMPGSTSMNSVGVKAYTSWKQGFEATMKTLRNGFYEGILAALRRGNDAQAVAEAVAASPWGTGNFSRLIE